MAPTGYDGAMLNIMVLFYIMSDWNPYFGGNRWEYDLFNDPWNTPHAEHPSQGAPSPWAHGDTFNAPPGCTDTEAHLFQDEVNDAIWRDIERTRLEQTPDNTIPSEFTLPEQQPAEAPSWVQREYDTAPRDTSWLPPSPQQEVVELKPTHHIERTQTKGLWKVVAGVAALMTAVGVADALSNSSQQKSQVEAQVNPDTSSFSCDVYGVGEDSPAGTARITFNASVEDKIVQVFATDADRTPVGMQNATPVEGFSTVYSFPSNGMHNQHIVVKAGTTVCKGEFTLGSSRTGDEQFTTP